MIQEAAPPSEAAARPELAETTSTSPIGQVPQAFEPDRELERAFRRGRLWPLLGPSLVSAGTLLWAYVVFGDLVIYQHLLGTFLVRAHQSGRRSLELLPAAPEAAGYRLFIPGLIAVGLVWTVVLVTSLSTRTTRASVESLVVIFLLGIAFGAVAVGRRLSGQNPNRPAGPVRALRLLGGILGGLLTLFVIARALTRL